MPFFENLLQQYTVTYLVSENADISKKSFICVAWYDHLTKMNALIYFPIINIANTAPSFQLLGYGV